MGKLEKYFDDYEVLVHNYGYALALTARFLNPNRAEKISKVVDPDDVLVGHSNGCTIASMIEKKQPVQGLILINAALDTDTEFKNSEWVDIYFNRGDEVVHWSKIFIAHPWGEMGKVGDGDKPHVTNIDCGPDTWGHSALFDDKNLPFWGPFIAGRVNDHNTRRIKSQTSG